MWIFMKQSWDRNEQQYVYVVHCELSIFSLLVFFLAESSFSGWFVKSFFFLILNIIYVIFFKMIYPIWYYFLLFKQIFIFYVFNSINFLYVKAFAQNATLIFSIR